MSEMHDILNRLQRLNESAQPVIEGSMKHMMHADAERMSREEFVDKYGEEDGEFWDNIMGELDEGKKKDHDGDGDIDSNDYLAARGNAIKAAIAKKKGDVEEGLAELADLLSLAGLKGKVELDELANEPGQGTKETTTYSVSDVIDQGNDLHAKSKQYADKAKLGDNPMATEEVDVVENKLWKAYQAELAGVKK